MKKNDDTIQALFDDYAEDFNERSDLASKATQALAAKNANQQNTSKSQRKPKIWNWLTPIFAALIVVVLSFSIWSPTNGDNVGPNGSNQNQADSSNDETQTTLKYYTSAEVKGRSVALTNFDETLNVSKIKDNEEYSVISERYYAFYFTNGELAYVKAVLGVRSDEGFCEIVIIAESDGVVRSDLRDAYDYYISGSKHANMYTRLDDKGEFVTEAYFNARNAHFYVYGMTGANRALAEKIISEIL